MKDPPVCTVYFILHLGQVSWYMPFLSYLLWVVPCFVAKRLSIMLSVVNVILTLVFLNNFVMNIVSFPKYVNFAHFLVVLFLFYLLIEFVLVEIS